MVTKQQQLEWLAKNLHDWTSVFNYVKMSTTVIGGYESRGWPDYHEIHYNEWQQEREKMEEQQTKLECSVMTLDEAIAHAEEKSRELKGLCAANHGKLAEWLTEYRDIMNNLNNTRQPAPDNTGLEQEPDNIPKQVNKIVFKNMKFKVNNHEHSKQVQEKLFELGYKWATGSNKKEVRAVSARYLYANSEGKITWGSWKEYFNAHENPEYLLVNNEFISATAVANVTLSPVEQTWYEKGEFPPIGAKVTVVNSHYYEISRQSDRCIGEECVVMATFSRDNGVDVVDMVCVMEPEGGCYCFRLDMIRPIRTEREKAIDELNALVGDIEKYPTWRDAIAGIIDAGYHK